MLAGLSGQVVAAEGPTRAIEARVDEGIPTNAKLHVGMRARVLPQLDLGVTFRQAFSVPFSTVADTTVAGEPIDLIISAEGLYTPNTIVLGDFAKALSIPGLRIGWLIDRDAARRAAFIDARSYFTISNSPLAEAIGALALEHSAKVVDRLRGVATANLALLTKFMDAHREVIEYTPPAGGTTCFPRLRRGQDARPLCEALARAGVLVAPGDCFEAPAHMRIGFGAQREGYAEALAVLSEVLAANPQLT